MTGSLPPHNPMSVARESMHMARQSGNRVFETVAMCSMCIMAFASMTHACLMLMRDLKHKDDHEKGTGRGR